MTSISSLAALGSAAPGRWRPPQRLLHLYSLLLLTIGLYRIGWTHGVTSDFRDRLGLRYRPVLLAVLSIVPVADIFVLFNLSKRIEELRKKSGTRTKSNPKEVAAITGLTNLLYGLNAYYFQKSGIDGVFVSLAALQLLLMPAPVLMVQVEYNALKCEFGDTGWTRPANTLLPHHKLMMAVVPVLFIAYAAFAFWDDLPAATGPTLVAGEKIAGKNKGYSLTVPDGGWLPLPEGRRAVDADLELSGRDGEAILVVFAECNRRLTLDEIVAYRRSQNAERLAEMTVSEDRRFDTDHFIPVSLARYSGLEMMGASVVWVSSAVDGRLDVEVIVNVLGEEPEDEAAAKAIVESLEILGEEEGCGSGSG